MLPRDSFLNSFFDPDFIQSLAIDLKSTFSGQVKNVPYLKLGFLTIKRSDLVKDSLLATYDIIEICILSKLVCSYVFESRYAKLKDWEEVIYLPKLQGINLLFLTRGNHRNLAFVEHTFLLVICNNKSFEEKLTRLVICDEVNC